MSETEPRLTQFEAEEFVSRNCCYRGALCRSAHLARRKALLCIGYAVGCRTAINGPAGKVLAETAWDVCSGTGKRTIFYLLYIAFFTESWPNTIRKHLFKPSPTCQVPADTIEYGSDVSYCFVHLCSNVKALFWGVAHNRAGKSTVFISMLLSCCLIEH